MGVDLDFDVAFIAIVGENNGWFFGSIILDFCGLAVEDGIFELQDLSLLVKEGNSDLDEFVGREIFLGIRLFDG